MSYTAPSSGSIAINFTGAGYTAPVSFSADLGSGPLRVVSSYTPPGNIVANLKSGSPAPAYLLEPINFSGFSGPARVVLYSDKPAISVKATSKKPLRVVDPKSSLLNFSEQFVEPDPKMVPLEFADDPTIIWPAYAQVSIQSPATAFRISIAEVPKGESAEIHLEIPKLADFDVDGSYLGYVTRQATMSVVTGRPRFGVAATYLGIPPQFATVGQAAPQPSMRVSGIYDNKVYRFEVMNDERHPWQAEGTPQSLMPSSRWQEPVDFVTYTRSPWDGGSLFQCPVTTLHQLMNPLNESAWTTWVLGAAVERASGTEFENGIPTYRNVNSLWAEGVSVGRAGSSIYQDGLVLNIGGRHVWEVSTQLLKLYGCGFDYRGVALNSKRTTTWQEGLLVIPVFSEFVPPKVPLGPPIVPPANPVPGKPNPLNFTCKLELGDPVTNTINVTSVIGTYGPSMPLQCDLYSGQSAPNAGHLWLNIGRGLRTFSTAVDGGQWFPNPRAVGLYFGRRPCESLEGGYAIPVMRTYLVINTLSMFRVDDSTPIEVLSASVSTDQSSWAWKLDAEVSYFDMAQIIPDQDGPVEVELIINSYRFRFIVESYSEDRSFGTTSVKINGRSTTALLDGTYAPRRTYLNTNQVRAKQAALDELSRNYVPSGFDLDWGIAVDQDPNGWLIEAGALSYLSLSPIEALNKIVMAAGGYLNSHPYERRVLAKPGYPLPSWQWSDFLNHTPDLILPKSIVTRQSLAWANSDEYNGVYVMGEQYGVSALVRRQGTIGDKLLETVVDPLITDSIVARERGIVELSRGGRTASVSMDIPLSSSLAGLVLPGTFVEVDPVGLERDSLWRGVVRGVSISAQWGDTLEVVQSIELERHY